MITPQIQTTQRRKVSQASSADFEGVFGVSAMCEPFNRPAANYMLQHADAYGLTTEQQDSIIDVLRKAGNGDSLMTKYTKGGGCDRWNACGVGLQRLQKNVRATICKGLWLDLDFVNCGPTLLVELCMKSKLHKDDYKFMADYVKNREQMLKDGAPFVTRDELKHVVIQLVYGKQLCAIKAEADAGDDANKLDGIEWLDPLEKELRFIRSAIAGQDEYAEIKSRLKNACNRDARILAEVLFVYENKCLETMYHHLQVQGMIQDAECVLTFDGIMVRATDRNKQRIGDHFLKEASKAIHEQTGFCLQVKQKPFSEGYELPDGFESTTRERYFQIQPGDDQAAADIIVSHLKGRLFKSGGRYFIRDENSVIFKEGEQAVRDAVISTTKTDLEIMFCQDGGKAQHYSKNTTKLNACIPRILADKSIVDDKFTCTMWENNQKYIAFTDGVYSFNEGRLLTFDEAIERRVFFTHDTQRPFPVCDAPPGEFRATDAQDPGGIQNGHSSGASAQDDMLDETHDDALDVIQDETVDEMQDNAPDEVQNDMLDEMYNDALDVIQDETVDEMQDMQDMQDSDVHEGAQDSVHDQLIYRVIEPLFPDAELRKHFFNCIARGLAGDIQDKRWYMIQGPRNCGKSTICNLLSEAFGPNVRMFGAENVLHRQSSQDAAKSQSWIKPFEFVRIAFSNELKYPGTAPKFDGEFLKRLCSNGDTIELRTNHKDEIQIRLQTTFVMAFNNDCEVTPPDAYQTMTGFKFQNEFHELHEIEKHACRSANDTACTEWKKNWLPKDPELENFIKRPDVIDAFTMLVLRNYTRDKQPPPAIVVEHTNSLKGDATESMEERFANMVKWTKDHNDVVFYKEIRADLERAGMGSLSHAKIDEYVLKLYGLKSSKPSKCIDGKMTQDRGFRELSLCAVGFDEGAARIRRNEGLRQSVRHTTHDNFTPDTRIGGP